MIKLQRAGSRGDPEAVRDPLDRYVDAVKALAGRRRASSRPSPHVSIAAKFSSTSIARYSLLRGDVGEAVLAEPFPHRRLSFVPTA